MSKGFTAAIRDVAHRTSSRFAIWTILARNTWQGLSADVAHTDAQATGSTTGFGALRALMMRNALRGIATVTHHTLMFSGVTALATLTLLFFKPHLTDNLKALSPFTIAAVQEPDMQPSSLAFAMDMPAAPLVQVSQPQAKHNALAANDDSAFKAWQLNATPNAGDGMEQQQRVTTWLSRRYRVANDAINMLVSASYNTASEIKLDPLLILSVIGIESGFNPFAESPVGAQGLMQVMSKIHRQKFQPLGGLKAALNPIANIKVGSLILKDYVTRGGSVEAGLKLYVGAAAFDTDAGYGSRVLAEYRRLKEVAQGKSATPAIAATAAAASVPTAAAPAAATSTSSASTPSRPVLEERPENKPGTPKETEAAAASNSEKQSNIRTATEELAAS